MAFGTKSPSLVTIFVSFSRCIFENLAFEEWLFRNHNMCSNGDSLLIWRNSPAVVIGRYQNPWLESDVRFCQANGIRLARRHSGGGAVYHDEGNINISVLTTHEGHSRKRNLQILAHFLNAELLCRLSDDVDIGTSRLIANSRDDLLIGKPPNGGAKVSGTAARIARGRAYHHFTLLVDVGMDALRHSLNSPFKDRIETNASRSVPAKSVGNLAQHIKRSTNQLVGTEELVEKVTDCVLRAFISQYESSKLVRWGGEMDKLRGFCNAPRKHSIRGAFVFSFKKSGKRRAFVYDTRTPFEFGVVFVLQEDVIAI